MGQLTTSDNSTTDSTTLTINAPTAAGGTDYPYYPILYNTLAGGLKVAYGVGDLASSGNGQDFWKGNYGQKPDPALNLPRRFSASGTLWNANTKILRKEMKGFAVRNSTINPVTGNYDLLGSNPKDGDTVMLEARVYNYSISLTPTSPITVQFSVIPYDSGTNNEICPGIPTTGTGGRVCPASARTIIGQGSSAPTGGQPTITLNARENQLVYLMWNTKGYGPQVGGAKDYRVYVDLITGPNPGEIYPPEPPCTAIPCEDNYGNQKIVDPGQNNEGWSLISVAAPASLSALATSTPKVTRLRLKADTHLAGAPQDSAAVAYLGRPLSVKVEASGNAAHPNHTHVVISNGKPGLASSQTIAAKIVQGVRLEGAHAWHDWRANAVGPYHLYTKLNAPGKEHTVSGLLVEVTRAPGDLNADGRVDTHDLTVLSRDLGKSVPESACGSECDLNGDGKINQTDSILIMNLCESNDCAFAFSYYVDGRISELEPDMRAVRTRDLAARRSWLAAHPEDAGRVSATPPQVISLAAYQQELTRKQSLRNTKYWYRGNPVTKGTLAPMIQIAGARVTNYAEKSTRNGTQVDVPVTIVNSGLGQLKGVQLANVTMRTLAGSGQATIAAGTLPTQVGDLAPGASKTVTLRLNVPTTVQRLSITEEGQITGADGTVLKYSTAQAIIP